MLQSVSTKVATTSSSLIRSYSEMLQMHDFEGRFKYLALKGIVGSPTFGSERYVNQNFYRSAQWQNVRQHVIARDLGMDLAVDGYDIHDRIIIHHMNPMTAEDITYGAPVIIDPEYLITTTHRTHNAIHYGDASLLIQPLIERRPGDTRLW